MHNISTIGVYPTQRLLTGSPSSSSSSSSRFIWIGSVGTTARVQASQLAVAVVAAAALFATVAGTTYTVGEPGGSWDLQTNLTAWASSIDFQTGDELVFKYAAAAHDVVEVTESGYRSCSAESPVATFRTGNDAIQLRGVLPRYFICGVPGHCAAGMKLEVRVRPAGCNSPPQPPSAEPSNGSPGWNGTPGGVCLGDNSPPTVIVSPSFPSSGAASGSSGSLSSVLTIMALLTLGLMLQLIVSIHSSCYTSVAIS